MGVTAQGKTLWWWLWVPFGVCLLYPLYVVPTYHFIRADQYLMAVVAFFLSIIFYFFAGIVASYIYNTKNLTDFYSEFLGSESKYKLKKIDLDPSLYDEEDLVHFKAKEVIADAVGVKGLDREVMREPLKIFYAVHSEGHPIAAPKAYVGPTGMAVLLSRVPSTFNVPLFEKFLLYHELEHLNIRGFRSTNTLALSQFLIFVHGVIGIVLSELLFDYICVFTYLSIVGYQRFFIMPAAREAVADHYAIRRLSDIEDIKRVCDLLIKAFSNEVVYAKTRKQAVEYELRLAKVQDLSLATSMADSLNMSIDDIAPRMRVDSFVNDSKVIFGSYFLMSMFIISEKDPSFYISVYIYSFLAFLVVSVIFMAVSRSLYHKIYVSAQRKVDT